MGYSNTCSLQGNTSASPSISRVMTPDDDSTRPGKNSESSAGKNKEKKKQPTAKKPKFHQIVWKLGTIFQESLLDLKGEVTKAMWITSLRRVVINDVSFLDGTAA